MELTRDEKAEAEFAEIRDTFHLLMGAKSDNLDTPVEIEVSFDGPEQEARRSLQIVVDEVRVEGYDVESHYIEQTESVTGDDLYRWAIRVTE